MCYELKNAKIELRSKAVDIIESQDIHMCRVLGFLVTTRTLCHIHYVTWSVSSGSSLPLIFCVHVRSGPIYWGVIYLAKKVIRRWYFTCKKPENIICDGILHVNMFHYFKIPYFTCTFFTKNFCNEYIGPYFLSHVVLRFSLVNSPSQLEI
jgi:hypothetical protein